MRQFRREDRLNEQILRDLSKLLDRELPELFAGVTTITSVRLTRDLRIARVYYSYLGEESERDRISQYLDREKARLRWEIGRHLRMRHIPEFTFTFDPSVERGMKIEQLLNEIKGNRKTQD